MCLSRLTKGVQEKLIDESNQRKKEKPTGQNKGEKCLKHISTEFGFL